MVIIINQSISFLAMSDTSITKGIEEEYSLDEEEPAEDNTSVALLSAARKS